MIRQEKRHKLSHSFDPCSMKVVKMKGSQVIVQSDVGVEYKRKMSHVKQYGSEDRLKRNEHSRRKQ